MVDETNPIDAEVNRLWGMPMKDWPKSLQEYVGSQFAKWGKCGEVAWDAIRGWVIQNKAWERDHV